MPKRRPFRLESKLCTWPLSAVTRLGNTMLTASKKVDDYRRAPRHLRARTAHADTRCVRPGPANGPTCGLSDLQARRGIRRKPGTANSRTACTKPRLKIEITRSCFAEAPRRPFRLESKLCTWPLSAVTRLQDTMLTASKQVDTYRQALRHLRASAAEQVTAHLRSRRPGV